MMFAVFVSCASPDDQVPAPKAPMSEPSETETSAAEVGHSAFAEPERLCLALEDEGLPPALSPTWKRFEGDTKYSCVADDLEVTPGGYNYVGDVPNVIEYYAESDTADRVDLFSLTASIFNEQQAGPVVSRFQELTQTLFERLNLPMPDGLSAAIDRGQSDTFNMEYGTVALTRESYNMGHGLVVRVDRAE
ncbi:hypothetical protein BSZ37_10305 [Rubrivirga marina]|uniref:Uncharacterized protein n=2 Tax=Rubrivirga marina TaxID=1196024 RepID=A0A271J0F8_9BACT|nr:hypothetical protein BSZ37_10305 [Rubrivirga marina]